MTTHFYNYRVEILKGLQFKTPEGNIIKNTASITLLDKNNEAIAYFELGYIPTDKIYDDIFAGKEINLDYCFIKNFSLTTYRKIFDLPKNSIVTITKFTAKHSVFEANIATDFSYAKIEDGNFDISNSYFLKGIFICNNVTFGKGTKNFSYLFLKNGNIDFTATDFGEGNVIFKNSFLGNGDKSFHDTIFGTGEKNFSNVDFGNGDIQFINTKFGNGKVQFKIASFGNGIKDFHYSSFGLGDINFERAEFNNGEVNFSKIDFGSGKLNFNRAVFQKGDISFEGSELKNGKATFKKTRFGEGILNFEIIDFSSSVMIFDKSDISRSETSFNSSRIKQLSFKYCNINKYLNLRITSCEELNLSETIVRDVVDLLPGETDVKIKSITIKGMRLLGNLLVDWKKNNLFILITTQEATSDIEKAEQFRILKKNFSDIGRYDDEDKAYLYFKRYEEKAKINKLKKELSTWHKIWYLPAHWFKILVFDKMGHYATNPLRVLFSMFVVYSFFSITYFLIILLKLGDIVSGIGGAHADISPFVKSFFFAAITFLTIGYGDFYPMGIIRFFSGLEGFVGVFMMSYFTVAFVRKILR